jgi:hypothetical protein
LDKEEVAEEGNGKKNGGTGKGRNGSPASFHGEPVAKIETMCNGFLEKFLDKTGKTHESNFRKNAGYAKFFPGTAPRAAVFVNWPRIGMGQRRKAWRMVECG